jgi:2-polyprenyl-3-methyl-5-hydroxy-6-metoxy-1,4-benzoquinol methylase
MTKPESQPVNPNPGKPPIAWFTESILTASALIAAAKLGLWRALDNTPLSLANLSRRLEVEPQGLEELTDALVAVGMLERCGNDLALTPAAQTWFTPSGAADYSSLLLWWADLLPEMVHLDAAVRDNRSFIGLWKKMEQNPAMGRHFSEFMLQSSKMLTGLLLKAAPLPDRDLRILDIGGSHGLFSLELCRKYPRVKATIFDLSAALSTTEKNIARYGLHERVNVVAGDFYQDALPGDYDVIMTLRFLHDHPEYKIRALLDKVWKSLKPGGEYWAVTMLKDSAYPQNALFSLLFYYEDGGRNLRYEQLQQWLEAARFQGVQCAGLPPSQFAMVTAHT